MHSCLTPIYKLCKQDTWLGHGNHNLQLIDTQTPVSSFASSDTKHSIRGLKSLSERQEVANRLKRVLLALYVFHKKGEKPIYGAFRTHPKTSSDWSPLKMTDGSKALAKHTYTGEQEGKMFTEST